MERSLSTPPLRSCLRDPIPEIAEAACYLKEAVAAHLLGQRDVANRRIQQADIPAIREWTESLWGRNSPYVKPRVVLNAQPSLPKEERIKVRMPTGDETRRLHERDGYQCRFCGIPVIRTEIRNRIRAAYPDALLWGRRNVDQHAAFQALWAQYDHVLPHAKGGDNDLSNIVITCAPCNFARMDYTLEEVGLSDPRLRDAIHSDWDGLERFC